MMMPRPEPAHIETLLDGWCEDGRHVYPLKVQYEDTDMAGIVYHAQYLAFAERGRSAMLRLAGVDQPKMAAAGNYFAVSRLKIKYASPARLGERLGVETRLHEMRAAVMILEQTITADDKTLAALFVDIAFINATGRPRRIPPDISKLILAAITLDSPATQ